jgi:hypothetical protein
MRALLRTAASTLRVRHLCVEFLVSGCLAFIIWLYMHSRATQTLDHVQVPVVIQLTQSQRDQFELELPSVPKTSASFTGPASRMRELRRKLTRGLIQATATYTLPDDKLKEATTCDMVRLDGAHLNVPPGILVEWGEPSLAIPVTIHRITERTLPVKLEHTGDVRVSQIKIEPAMVLVRGPKAVLDRAQSIATLPIEFTTPAEEDPKDSQPKETVGLIGELGGRPVQVTPAQVEFRCKVQPRKKIYEVRDVPIRFAIPDRYPWQPRFEGTGKLTLRVIGPALEEMPRVRAYLDLDQEVYGAGRNLGPVRIELPKEFELVERISQPTAAFYLEERGAVEPRQAAHPTPEFEIRPTSKKKLD